MSFLSRVSLKIPTITKKELELPTLKKVENNKIFLEAIKVEAPEQLKEISSGRAVDLSSEKPSSKKRKNPFLDVALDVVVKKRCINEGKAMNIKSIQKEQVVGEVKVVKLNHTIRNKITHFLPMKGEIFMINIEKGIKEFEGRIFAPTCRRMRVGDHLKMFDGQARWGIICEITSLDVYDTFEGMLNAKGILKLLPQLEPLSRELRPEELLRKGVDIYRGFPGSNRVTKDGVVAIGVKFLERTYTK